MKVALAALALLLSAPTLADVPPVPKLYRSMSGTHSGQWRMEILESERGGRKTPVGRMGAVTLCTDNLLAQRGRDSAPRGRAGCRYRLEKDTASEAIMLAECPDAWSRVHLTREGAKRVLMQAEHRARGETSRVKMRYTYLGACRAGQGTMSLDPNSDACRRMRAQASKLDPAQSCADAGERRAECEARVRAAAEQMASMCR